VLGNLLDNAIKYSPHGSQIEITLTQPQADLVEVSVRDHGIGIPPDRRDRLFERYYQAHGDGFASGMGLGLYVSRQILRLHDGDLRAELPDDGGACFVISLPSARSQESGGRIKAVDVGRVWMMPGRLTPDS